MSGTTEAAQGGLRYLNFLLENFSGQAVSKLTEAGAHPASVATDIRNAHQLLQGIKIATEVEDGQEEEGNTPKPAQSTRKRPRKPTQV
jgi:hypothetical protein